MFDRERFGLDARTAQVLERIYHKGNRLSWDGKEVLSSLIAEHGVPKLADRDREALGRVFSVILWGELAAWRISAELADELESLEAKMAATSQAFDEARHFYVMHDYLLALDAMPERMPRGAEALLIEVMNADSLAKKLLGMQLMVEPVALTLFQLIRGLEIEPVLTHLLPYYERDEARHVALGLKYLPSLIRKMSKMERLGLWAYQAKLLSLEVLTQKTLRDDLEILGLDPRLMVDVGRGKQMTAISAVFDEANDGKRDIANEVLERYVDVFVEWSLPDKSQPTTFMSRCRRAMHVLVNGSEADEEHNTLDPGIVDEQVPLIHGLRSDAEAKSA
jgi:hypothetical protein